MAIGSKSSCKMKPVPSHADGTKIPKMKAKTACRQFIPELYASKNTVTDKAPAQKVAPPGKSAKEVVCPSDMVADPSQTRVGASTPFNVAWATTEKTITTLSARRFPVPAKIVSRDIQPRVCTMPMPNISPPKTMAKIGMS